MVASSTGTLYRVEATGRPVILLALLACADTKIELGWVPPTDVEGTCPPFLGFPAEGATRRYADPHDSSQHHELRVDSVEGASVRVSSAFWIGTPLDLEVTQTFVCDEDGAWFHGPAVVARSSLDGGTTTTTTYARPLLVMPNGLDVGRTWTASYLGETVMNDEEPQAFEYERIMEVRSHETITTAAGEFEALEIADVTDDEDAEGQWYEAELGLVKSGEVELVGYTP